MSDKKYITSLSILKRDGTTVSVQGSKLRLAEGVFMGMKADPADNSVTLSAGPDKGSVDQDMQDKFNALIYGGSGTAHGVPYTFVGPTGEGAPYYFSKIDGASPLDGHAFLTVKLSSHIGLFEDGSHPSGEDKGVLDITDVNRPCTDCSEYADLYKYVDALRDALEEKKDRVYKEVSQDAGDDVQRNILALDKQLFLYWNNMVQRTAWRCNAVANGAELNAAMMFTNHFDAPLGAGTYFKISVVSAPFYLPGGDLSDASHLTPPEGKLIDYSIPSGWIEGIDYDVIEEPSAPQGIRTSTWQANFSAKTVTITVADNDAVEYVKTGSFVYIFKSSDNGAGFVQGAYEVVSVGSSSFDIYVPNLESSEIGSGELGWTVLITLGLLLNSPLYVGDSVRLYAGAYAWDYVGSEGCADIVFRNNIEDSFPGYPSSKKITTNNMVVVSVEE